MYLLFTQKGKVMDILGGGGEEIKSVVSDIVSLRSLLGMQMKVLSNLLNIQACFLEEQFGLERLLERFEHEVGIEYCNTR